MCKKIGSLFLCAFLILPLGCSSHPAQFCNICNAYHDPQHEHFRLVYSEPVIVEEERAAVVHPVVQPGQTVTAQPVQSHNYKLLCPLCGAYYTPKYYCKVCGAYYHPKHRHDCR
jgi:hypothetical protein